MIKEFFLNNFYYAWKYETGYNIYTTFLNVLIFLIVAYIFYKTIEKHNVTISDNFLYGSMAWALFGISLRLLNDLKVVKSIFLLTPFIYIETLVLASASLFLLLKYKPTIKTHRYTLTYWQIWMKIPLISSVPFLWLNITKSISQGSINFSYFFLTLWLWIISLLLIALARNKLNTLKPIWSVKTLWFQMLDALSTFVAMTFLGFKEEHILAKNLILYTEKLNMTFYGSGAWSFLVLKILIVYFALYLIEKYITDIKEKRLIKYFIIMLGFIVGTRNLLNILLNSS